MAGLETGCGNRSFRGLYPKKVQSAQLIEQLIDAGAVLVGKTKTSQFADGQEPSEWYFSTLAMHLSAWSIENDV